MIVSEADIVFRGAVESYTFTTVRVKGYHLHDIEVVGPIDLRRRVPLYHETVRHSLPPHYFCIIDNLAGHENTVTFDNIRQLDQILKAGGIEYYYGASVTKDQGYSSIVKLAQEHLESIGITSELVQVQDRAAAEAFILKKIDEVTALLEKQG